MNFNDMVSSFGEKLKPLGASMGKGLAQMEQFAKEKLGNVHDITELPSEYKELEAGVDRISLLYSNFLRVARNYTLPHYDYEPPLANTVADFATSVGDKANYLAERALSGGRNNVSSPTTTSLETAPSLSHAFSRVAIISSDLISSQDPLHAALKKFSDAQERMGRQRLNQDEDVKLKFYGPFLQFMENNVDAANKARKKVQSVRLTYDAFRAKVKNSRPENADAARQDMEAAEDEFVAAVDDAMGKMKAVVESPNALKHLADLVAIQLEYYKTVTEILSELAPEMDELVNQWAMDFEGNYKNILDSIQEAIRQNAKLRSGPELEICGYGCNDHFYESDTVEHSWDMIADLIYRSNILVDVGLPISFKNCLYNCRLVLAHGKILGIRPKITLANDGNYRESRWFTPWKRGVVVDFPLPAKIKRLTKQTTVPMGDIVLRTSDGITIGFETCEELFTPFASNIYHAVLGTDIILNGSASHHELLKLQKRVELISGASKNGGIYMYSNLLGCDGERVYYDGCPLIMANENLLAQGSQFSLDKVQVVVANIDINATRSYQGSRIGRSNQAVDFMGKTPIDVDFSFGNEDDSWEVFTQITQPISVHYYKSEEEIRLGPACWLWDYLRRSNATGFFLPLSGGIDSCSVSLIVFSMCSLVHEAVKSGNESVLKDVQRICNDENYISLDPRELCSRILHTCFMGSINSSKETRSRANSLANTLGSYHVDCDIDTIVDSFLNVFVSVTNLTPRFTLYGGTSQENLALQNLQARIRMVLSYLFSQLVPLCRNRSGSLLVLSCGNVDETLRGYLTKYDCSSADINPIGGVSKLDLQLFVKFMRDQMNLPLLDEFLAAPPTAELEPRSSTYVQSDEADMGMTYKELSLFGLLRKVYRCGPISMYRYLIPHWGSFLSPSQISEKVKSFFVHYSKNRHKTNVLPPSYHMSQYSPDDNRFDLRQILYNSSWVTQFKAIDTLVESHINDQADDETEDEIDEE